MWKTALLMSAAMLAVCSLTAAENPAMATKIDKGIRLNVPAGFKLPLAEKDVPNLPGPAFTREFKVLQDGYYRLKWHVFASGNGSDSLYYRVNKGKVNQLYVGPEYNVWQDKTTGNMELAAGTAQLEVYPRENNMIVGNVTLEFVRAIPQRTIVLTGKSPYTFRVTAETEFRIETVYAADVWEKELRCTFRIDNGFLKRRRIFSKGAEKSYRTLLAHVILKPGTHTMELTLPDEGKLVSLKLIPANRKITVPAAAQTYKPPFAPVKGEHPRLLMRKCHIPQIKQNFTSPENAPYWKLVQQKAARPFRMPEQDGVVIYSYSAHYDIECRAFMCAVTGNEAMGKAAIREIREYMDKIDFDNRGDVTRIIGRLIFSASLVYDWCYPLLTPEDKADMRSAMLRLGKDQEIGWPPFRQGVINGHGNESQLSRDFLGMAIAVYDEDPYPWQLCSYRILEEMVPAHRYEYASGRHAQGSDYGPCRFAWDLHALMTLERLTGKCVFDENIKTVPYCWIYLMQPNRELLDDTDIWIEKGHPYSYGQPFFNMYAVTGDPFLKAEFLRQSPSGFASGDPLWYLLFNRPEVKTLPDYTHLPLVRHFTAPLPSMLAHSSWCFGPYSPSAVVEMKGAMYNRHDHQHAEAGAFQVYFRAPLLVDIGVYTAWGSPYDFTFSKRTIAHNCMLFYDPEEKFSVPGNDGGQRFNRVMPRSIQAVIDHPEHHSTGSTLAADYGPDAQQPLYAHLKSDLTPAYNAHKLAGYTRSFVYCNTGKPDAPALLIVYDRAQTTKAEYRKYFVLNSPAKPEQKGRILTYKNHLPKGPDGMAAVTTLLPRKASYEFAGNGEAMKFFREQVKYPTKNVHLSKGWRTMISPAKAAVKDDFLNVIEVGTPETLRPTAKLTEADGRRYVFAANWLVGFADSNRTGAQFTLKDKRFVLLTDLEPGDYTVKHNGKLLGHAAVRPDAGTLFLDGMPGTYEVAPGKAGQLLPPSRSKAAVPSPENNAKVRLNGEPVALNPVPGSGTWYWPVEEAAKIFGRTVRISPEKAEFTVDGTVFTARPGSRELQWEKGTVPLTAPAIIRNGTWLLPEQSLALLWGMLPERSGEYLLLQKSELPVIACQVPPHTERNVFLMFQQDPGSDYWGAAGRNTAVTFYFGKLKQTDQLAVAWLAGNTRKESFAIELSTDGRTFREVWKGESSGKTNALETYRFPMQDTAAVRLKLFGNSDNEWNSICRIRIGR